jgi:hypothetical protein
MEKTQWVVFIFEKAVAEVSSDHFFFTSKLVGVYLTTISTRLFACSSEANLGLANLGRVFP